MLEWYCEGCGWRVTTFGIDAPPRHGLCNTCRWLCENVTDPQAIEGIRRIHGWVRPAWQRSQHSSVTAR